MIYTEKDIDIFIQAQRWLNDPNDTSLAYFCFVTINEIKNRLYIKNLLRILDIKRKYIPDYKSIPNPSLPCLQKFIHETPLYQVPLYINDYPEFAAWRLRLAK
jgi:hypothetical protein